jgi:hypothetical protein
MVAILKEIPVNDGFTLVVRRHQKSRSSRRNIPPPKTSFPLKFSVFLSNERDPTLHEKHEKPQHATNNKRDIPEPLCTSPSTISMSLSMNLLNLDIEQNSVHAIQLDQNSNCVITKNN